MKKSPIYIALLSVLSSSTMAEIIFKGDFETGRVQPMGREIDSFYEETLDKYGNTALNSYSYQNDSHVVTSPTRAGSYSYKATIRYNGDYSGGANNGYHKPRSDIVVARDSVTFRLEKEYWVAHSFFVPSDWVIDRDDNADSLMQIFKHSNRDHGPVAFGLNIKGDEVRFDALHSNSSMDDRRSKMFPLTKGKWVDYVMHFKLCASNCTDQDGFMNLYWNGSKTPVFQTKGRNTEGAEAVLTINLYKYGWQCRSEYQYSKSVCRNNPSPTNDKGTRTIYHDEIRIGDQYSSYQQVSPHSYNGITSGSLAPTPPTAVSIQ